jgi:hypothetical protein
LFCTCIFITLYLRIMKAWSLFKPLAIRFPIKQITTNIWIFQCVQNNNNVKCFIIWYTHSKYFHLGMLFDRGLERNFYDQKSSILLRCLALCKTDRSVEHQINVV